MHPRYLRAGLSALAFLVVAAGICRAQVATQKIKLDTSFVYTRGSYGLPTDTDIYVVLVNPSYETDTWRLQASLPYVHLKGAASVVGNAGTSAASRTEEGMGDASVTVTRKLGDVGEGWFPSFAAKVKLPTADESKGLGTGKTDFSFEADLFKKVGDLVPYGTFGYQFLGHSQAYPMKSGFYASAGFADTVAPKIVVGVGGNWRERIISGGSQALELMAFVQRTLSDNLHLQLFALHGFTDASPDLALGATLGLTF